ncbi:hypothetical protein ACFV30_14650 [Streptomyces sp. NPDC059752]|uniref:hypothetical protein n=1 Tax=unclassified Streptomyces TaxID=2593676 RepID=UPI00366723BF
MWSRWAAATTRPPATTPREALLQFAEAASVTQIVLGASRRGRFSTVLRDGVGHRTIRRSGPIDVLVVTHEAAAGASSTLRVPHPSPLRDPLASA